MQKTEPIYSYVLPHRNPLRCPVGALAILLHFMFGQENLLGCLPEWDWENSASWRQVCSCAIFQCRIYAHRDTQFKIRFMSYLEGVLLTQLLETQLGECTPPS